MGIVKSGATADELDVDQGNLAARFTTYGTDGVMVSPRKAFAAAADRLGTTFNVTVANSTAPFAEILGSASKTIRVTRVSFSSTAGASTGNFVLLCSKRSTVNTGGTRVLYLPVPMDPANQPSGATAAVTLYSAAPTAGTLVAVVEVRRIDISLAADDQGEFCNRAIFDFRDYSAEGAQLVTLRGTSECLDFAWGTAPGFTTNVAFTIEWTEE